jgi:glycosyltransferase involved in cell wall biosynthesis
MSGAGRIRVCLVSPLPPPYGGIGNWTQLVVAHARGRGDVAIDLVDVSPRWRAFHDMAVWKRTVGGGLQLLRDLAQLSALLVARRPRAVHVTTPGGFAVVRDVAMLSLAWALQIPGVYHIRFGRVPEIAAARSAEWRMMRLAIELAGTVVAIDRATAQALRRHAPGARVQLIPNCVDAGALRSAAPGRAGPPTVVYLGWIIPTKGIEELLAAWALLRPRGWRLLVVGPAADAYRARLEVGRPAGVEFAGELPHDAAMRAVAGAEVLVLPSHTEGFPNAVLEAMALGKAIVASRVGALPEMLEGGCGVLVPPRDAGALAAALGQVIADEGLRRALGMRARARAWAEYHVEPVFERYLALWRGGAGEG